MVWYGMVWHGMAWYGSTYLHAIGFGFFFLGICLLIALHLKLDRANSLPTHALQHCRCRCLLSHI